MKRGGRKVKKQAVAKHVNGHAQRSRLIFECMRVMKDKKANTISEITRRNGQKGVCPSTIRKMYLKPANGGTCWPSSRTLESIIYSLGGSISVNMPKGDED